MGAVDQPARTSAIPRLVPAERLPAAIALNQLGFNTMAVIGPALGGLLIATVGVATAFLFDAVTFVGGDRGTPPDRPDPAPSRARPDPSLETVREGLRFVRGRRVVLSSFVVDLVAMVFGMPTSLFPALALDVFGVGPAGRRAADGGAGRRGACRGRALRLGRPDRPAGARRDRRRGRLGRGDHRVRRHDVRAPRVAELSFALALVFLACAGAADVFSAVLRSAIVQLDTPDELRGRVASIHILVVTSGPRLGDAEAAAVAAVAGPAALGAVGRHPLPRRPRRGCAPVPGAAPVTSTPRTARRNRWPEPHPGRTGFPRISPVACAGPDINPS